MATLHLKRGWTPKPAKVKKTIGKLAVFRAPTRASKYRVTGRPASFRRPGWSNEARAAAYASRMANARKYRAYGAGARFAANIHHLRIGRVAALSAGPKTYRKGKVRHGGVLQAFGSYGNRYTRQVVRAVRAGKAIPGYRMPTPKKPKRSHRL